MEHLLSVPAWLALLVVFALPALESSAFLGFIFPGEMAVLLGGVVASQGRVELLAVVAAAVGGAIAGDAVGYLVGRRWGRCILASTLGRLINAEHLDRAERALVRRGGVAVLLGRFSVALRVLVPGLAGMAGVSWRRFATFNVAGALVWGSGTVVAGYLAGSSWHTVEQAISRSGAGITLALVAAVIAARALSRRRRKQCTSREPGGRRA